MAAVLPFRRRHPPGTAETMVSVSGGLGSLAPALALALGPGFDVVVDRPSDALVALIGPVGLPGVRFLKLRHPRTALIVVDRATPDPDRSVGYLDAGADGYLNRRTTDEIAAHVRAVARRADAS
jgi:hypothetical protein